MFAEIGGGCYIEPPPHADRGGHHVHFGSNVYANLGLTPEDDTHIFIGGGTMLGPSVTIATAGHPILPALRRLGYQYNAPVHIGKNCWLGAGVIVLPGITIGGDTAAARAASSRTICRAVWRTSGAVPCAVSDRRRRQDLLFPRPADTGGGADCRRRERRGTVSKTQRTVGLTHGPLSFFRYPANWLLYSLA